MFGALFKKQFMEINTFYFQDKRTGKRRSKVGIIGFTFLFIMLFACLGVAVGGVADMLADAFLPIGLSWLYFAILILMALALGIFGSVFNTYAGLYMAKDNELLLSMPVPPSYILIVRMTGVYLFGLLFESIVLVPAVIVYWIKSAPTVLSVIFSVLLIPVTGLLILVLTCFFGYIIALIASHTKRKNILSVFFSIIFIAVYYVFYFKLNTLITSIAANGEKVGNTLKSAAYPIYEAGRAAEGDPLAMLIFTAFCAVLTVIAYIILSRTFIKLATKNNGTVKTEYKEKTAKQSSVGQALFRKEMRRFLQSPTYILNCGLGILFMLAAVVVIIIKADVIKAFLNIVSAQFGAVGFIPVAIMAAVCTLSGTCDISSPSVSLEGKNLWILRSLPVNAYDILLAKYRLHCAITLPPVVLLSATASYVFGIGFSMGIYVTVISCLYVMFTAALGVFLNLNFPCIEWTTEVVPIKQSMSVLFALFGGMLGGVILGAAYYLLRNTLSAENYLIICIVVLALVVRSLLSWLKNKGAQKFEKL